MTNDRIIRAWKDEEYRLGLSNADKAVLPANPAGVAEILDADMDGVAGGATYLAACSIVCTDLICSIIYSCFDEGPCRYIPV